MENDLLKLQDMLLKNFTILQSNVENFLENNKKLLDIYLDNVTQGEYFVVKSYRDYIIGLFTMLVNNTDFIKAMMLEAQNKANTLVSNFAVSSDELRSCDTASTTSESTLTGYRNGFTCMEELSATNSEKRRSSSECNGISLSNGIDEKTKEPYKNVDISFLKPGAIIPKAHVTSVHLDTFHFHICLPNTRDLDVLLQLYNARDRPVYSCSPTAGIIFGLRIDDGIVRAIRCKPVSSGKVYLLDFGDIVNVNKNLNNIFPLRDEEQKIPAQAILCKLHIPADTTNSEMNLQREHLSQLLYQHTSFQVVGIDNEVLVLAVYQAQSDPKFGNESSTSNVKRPDSAEKIPEEKCDLSQLEQLSLEELEMLNDEPAGTSNALLAVLGHVPKDDKRICRFYDPKLDGCFKGNNCRLQHVPLREDYITKDIMPANAYSELPSMVPVAYDTNQILRITVTHIKNLEYFYGIILHNSMHTEPFIWKDIDVPASDLLQKPPLTYDIVLAKFDDGLWYRAQVLDVDEMKKTFKVFYMDYGNRQIVSLKNLAKCTEHVAKLPAQAQLFRLADVRIIPDDKETQMRGISMLCDMVLNSDVNVIVVSHYEDLVVRFLDEPLSEIPNLLANMNCVQLIEMVSV